jgi:dipeptidyl aminopeptidase/acylaminoacyl peptidase
MTSKEKADFKQYLSIHTTGGARWHPKDKIITYISDSPGNFQVFSTDIKEGKTCFSVQLTKDENRSTDPRYLSDGSLAFLRDESGNENFQIFCLDKNNKLTQISEDLSAKHIITSVSENYVYFRANIEDKARFDIYRIKIPITSNRPEKIYQPAEGIPYGAFSTDDTRIIFQLVFGNMHQEIILIDLEQNYDANLTIPISKGDKIRWNAIRWLDEKHLLVATDYQSDFRKLGILSVDSRYKDIENLPSNYDISAVTWNKDSKYTYVVYNEEGYSKLYRGIFTETGVEKFENIALPIPGVVTSGDARSFTQSLDLSSDEKQLAVTITASNSPFNSWILDIDKNIWWKATKGDTAGLDPTDFIQTSLSRFISFDGLSVPYFKYLPKGIKPENGWPAIFIIHGGPEAQMLPSFNPVIQFFVSSGYAIIAPNIRGSAGYGRKYLDLDNKEKRLDSIMDIKHLALHLRTDNDIDNDKLIIYGGSYGGFAVLSAMTEHPEIWAAGIDVVGISNFVTFLQNTAAWRRKHRESEYGSLEHDMDMLKSISPIHKIDNISAPLFIIHGDNDERVPLSEALQIYKILTDKGLQTQLLRFSDEGHGITKLKNKIVAYSQIVEWLEDTVLG